MGLHLRRWIVIGMTLGVWPTPALGEVPQVGDVAPDFALESLDGEQVVLSALKGQVVLLNFLGYD